MTISVIIPTYNGAHRIPGLLRSLERQTTPPDEVVVVVDGSQDGTAELLHAQSWDLGKLRIIEQANGGRAQVRNRGAAEATGELLIFLDDDQIAAPELVEAHLRHHRDHPDSIATGRLEPMPTRQRSDVERFKVWLHRRWTRDWQVTSAGSQLLADPYLTAANLSMPSPLFAGLEGFDARLRDVEDHDLARRARDAGIALYLASSALSYNDDPDQSSFRDYLCRQRHYAAAHRLLHQLQPQGEARARPRVFWKRWILLLLRQAWWERSVDEGVWLWLPVPVRYRLYDLILTAQLENPS